MEYRIQNTGDRRQNTANQGTRITGNQDAGYQQTRKSAPYGVLWRKTDPIP